MVEPQMAEPSSPQENWTTARYMAAWSEICPVPPSWLEIFGSTGYTGLAQTDDHGSSVHVD